MSMESVPALFYNIISNRAFEIINFIKDYLSGNNMSKYRPLTEKNLCGREKILLLSKEIKRIGITEESYINNGYILNSADRVIIADLDLKANGTCYASYFSYVAEYVSDPTKSETLKNISCYIFNKRILSEIDTETDAGNIMIFRIAYNIARQCFIKAMNENSAIEIIKNTSRSAVSTTSKVYANITDDPVFYIDFLISIIMVLDTMFDLKFGDMKDVKAAIPSTNNIIDCCFEEIYNYAIDINPDPDDYKNIFVKLFDDIGYNIY